MLHISSVFSTTVENGYQIIPVKTDQLGKLIFSGGMNSTDLPSIYMHTYLCIYIHIYKWVHTPTDTPVPPYSGLDFSRRYLGKG